MITQRRVTALLVVVTVVAVGLIGLELTRPRSESTSATAPPGPSATPVSSSAAPTSTPTVVDEPFDPDAPIPGCASVEKPGSSTTYSAFASTGQQSYDNPKFPWFSASKATAMSQAVVGDLPDGADVVFAPPSRSFVFEPIFDYGDDAPDDIGGTTTASGAITRGSAIGTMFVSVRKADRPIPACVAGELDARRTMPDGTVVDVHDTWTETDGRRRLSRTANAYAGDGSWIGAQADDRRSATGDDFSGQVPLTVDELVAVVTDERLRVTASVPPGTPAPRKDCVTALDEKGPPVTREQAARLDAVLAGVDLGGRRFLPLQPADSSDSSLCTSTVPDGNPTSVDIVITGGQSPPTPRRPEPFSDPGNTTTLPDGTVLETRRDAGSSGLTTSGERTVPETGATAVVTRPSGTQVTVSSRAAVPMPPLPDATLQSIALTPGLEF